MSKLYSIVLLRHGQSQWNLENRFTGWVDVDLTPQGREEARQAGELLRAKGYHFDRAFTSVLKRAIRTLWITLDTIDQMWIPIHNEWRLNERHYGALTGLNKSETAAKYGEEQVLLWRRAFNVRPAPLEPQDERWPGHDPRYAGLDPASLPLTECLEDTILRVIPTWTEHIAPRVLAGERILIAAHGNSIRALIKHLEGMSETDILALNIPTAQPLVITLDENLKFVGREYLAEPEVIQAALAAIAHQGKAKSA